MKREEGEIKARQKSSALRKYAKLCEKEGVDSQRVNLSKNPAVSETTTAAQPSDAAVSDEKKKKKKAKSVQRPVFEKEKKKAQELQQSRDQREKEIKTRELEKRQALNKRNEKRKMHMKTTRKGQPLMNNKINSLLEKIRNSS